ncbi:MAG TPA: magnesium transporter CorA family protein [Tenuifilaceae bacterium]|nr:magnesium transporter CorA family protein [Tenuifilaceae bacterium]HPI43611.1 magnesium transporter CorA family protein [Tenuifilaceae bacterium]HPN21783.1 magnesium transporter CorA family protein [Tenuifilaceae bacterium]HPV55691.1 magnesium transporter CorA family protein [Tenuifilaceae bacterium]
MKTYWKNGKGIVSCPQWEPNCWVSVEIPTDEEKRYLIDELGVPEAFYNDIEDVDERPRIEYDEGWFFILLRIPYKNSDSSIPYSTVPLGIIFKDDVFVSICFYQTEILPDFIQFTYRKNITKRDNFDLVLRLMLSSSVWFLKYLKQINQSIKLAETQLERSIKNEDLQALLKIEKSLVFFTTSLKGNDILLHRIKNLRNYKDTYDPELVEDVEIELRQAQETTNVYSDILSGMMDAYASVISNNLNIIMKQLTSISIILMIPTLIASLYGMNVPNGFENVRWGFWIILFVSFLFSMFGVVLFMRKRWF